MPDSTDSTGLYRGRRRRGKRKPVTAGRYYHFPRITEAHPGPGEAPAVVMCRRLADYPGGRSPALPNVGIGACTQCGAAICFNTAGPHQDVQKACAQCCGVQPDPYEVPT